MRARGAEVNEITISDDHSVNRMIFGPSRELSVYQRWSARESEEECKVRLMPSAGFGQGYDTRLHPFGGVPCRDLVSNPFAAIRVEPQCDDPGALDTR